MATQNPQMPRCLERSSFASRAPAAAAVRAAVRADPFHGLVSGGVQEYAQDDAQGQIYGIRRQETFYNRRTGRAVLIKYDNGSIAYLGSPPQPRPRQAKPHGIWRRKRAGGTP